MAISSFFAKAMLDRQFGNTTYNVPSNLYVGLATATITASTTGTTVVEPAGAQNYARVLVSNSDKTNWNTAVEDSTGAYLTNKTSVSFNESGASGWGSITFVFIADALTNGNIICYEQLSSPRTVQANTTVIFSSSPAAITISMSNS